MSEITESGKTSNDSQIATLKAFEILQDLDTKIAKTIVDATELEAEVFESEEIQDTIIEKIGHINFFLARRLDPVTITKGSTHTTQRLDAYTPPFQQYTMEQEENTSIKEHSEEPLLIQRSSHKVCPTERDHGGIVTNVSRLPKLSLPIFSGEPLSWQTFWDFFSAAVDSNHTLSGVQKFNYQRAQLQGTLPEPLQDFHSQMKTTIILLISSKDDLDNHTQLSMPTYRHY